MRAQSEMRSISSEQVESGNPRTVLVADAALERDAIGEYTRRPVDDDDERAEAVRFFKARLAATVHEYGEKGVPIGSLRRKFAQVRCGERRGAPPVRQ